ncbi:hypothetical protein BIV60_11435 [Bacillus sp. MUM 116]|nr:hypothetical protein BIV60_11435 [Bacillus sp. MUM 116]
MSIIKFPEKKNNHQKKRLVVDSEEKAFVNHEFIRSVMEKKGYRRADDILVKELRKLITNYHQL